MIGVKMGQHDGCNICCACAQAIKHTGWLVLFDQRRPEQTGIDPKRQTAPGTFRDPGP